MKVNYKTRMTAGKQQKLEEEQRKEILNQVRSGIAQPFGCQGKHIRALRNSSLNIQWGLAVPIAAELDAYWTVITKPPFDAEKAQRNEKRKRSRAVPTGAGEPEGDLQELEPLPMDDIEMQLMDGQDRVVRVQKKVYAPLRLILNIGRINRMANRTAKAENAWDQMRYACK